MQSLRESTTPYKLYLSVISSLGLLITGWGVFQVGSYTPLSIFLVLLVLAIFAEFATTSVLVAEESGITFDVGTSVGVATIPIFGPLAAAVVVAAANVGIWLLKPGNGNTWKKSISQLFFNNGMHAVAILIAGWVFLWLQPQLGAASFWGRTVPFLVTAVIYDQLNLWLLLIILRLQHGASFSPFAVWKENVWAMPINIIVLAAGGSFLSFAAQQFGLSGLLVFFIPIILTTYAFRLYVRQMRSHMDNLESIVAERTQELAARTQELEMVNRDKDAFLAVLTHDMKTPLNTIGLYAELIERRPTILESKPHIPSTIWRNQQALLTIVNNILDLEKLQAGEGMPLQKEPFDLQMLTEYLVESVFPQAKEKGIALTYHPQLTAVTLEADRPQIERALLNLISNAIKYTPEGGKIEIALREEGKTAVIDIHDSGYGIPADELPYIFDRYRRVGKHKHLASGTGLGLAVAKAIIEAHSGHITVTSKEHKGSHFTLTLPALTISPAPTYHHA